MLILAATPIGNLGDASPRLIQTLREATHIAAEDTRVLRRLAQALGIELQAELISLHEHNELQKLDSLVELAKNQNLVLVSDAGMPTISDPGFALVRACRESDVDVRIVPGASAVISALALSGLPTDRFCFEGFIPRKSGERQDFFLNLASETRTMVFFESPYRIEQSLLDAAKVFGETRPAALSRELTKLFEETKRGTLAELASYAKDLKGELVLVIAGALRQSVEVGDLVSEVEKLRSGGAGLKDSVAVVAKEHGVSASALYAAALAKQQ